MLSRCLPSVLRSVSVRPTVTHSVFQLPSLNQRGTGTHSRFTSRQFSTCRTLRVQQDSQTPQKEDPKGKVSIRENIYTLPNLLTLSRILACPVLGWTILNDDFYLATGLLVYAGTSDLVRRLLQCFRGTTLRITGWKD